MHKLLHQHTYQQNRLLINTRNVNKQSVDMDILTQNVHNRPLINIELLITQTERIQKSNKMCKTRGLYT